jgi:hypothetical protein
LTSPRPVCYSPVQGFFTDLDQGRRVRRTQAAAKAGVLLATTLITSSAVAGSNDITLQRFGEVVQDPELGLFVRQDDKGFNNLTRDLALVLTPRGGVSAETLGQAGFAFQVDQGFSTVDAGEDYWLKADVDRDPAGTLTTTQLHVRKGLPFGFEIGANLNALWQSQLFLIGGELRWSLHEDFFRGMPDLTVRGFGGTMVGSPQLNLSVGGFDAVVSHPIGVASVMNITPYAGYSMTVAASASRLLDATPSDPSPPVTDTSDPSNSNKPEFVFGPTTQILHQGLVGIRFQFAVVDVGFQAAVGGAVQTYTLSLALDF